jgi:hypothetical protein
MDKGDFDVRREACWAIGNAISGGSNVQIAYLVQQGCIKPLCELLVTADAKLTMVRPSLAFPFPLSNFFTSARPELTRGYPPRRRSQL